jgi:hypothetical protein
VSGAKNSAGYHKYSPMQSLLPQVKNRKLLTNALPRPFHGSCRKMSQRGKALPALSSGRHHKPNKAGPSLLNLDILMDVVCYNRLDGRLSSTKELVEPLTFNLCFILRLRELVAKSTFLPNRRAIRSRLIVVVQSFGWENRVFYWVRCVSLYSCWVMSTAYRLKYTIEIH